MLPMLLSVGAIQLGARIGMAIQKLQNAPESGKKAMSELGQLQLLELRLNTSALPSSADGACQLAYDREGPDSDIGFA